MSYSILKQGPLTKKPIFFLIGGFIAVTIFFTVLFSLKEQDKLEQLLLHHQMVEIIDQIGGHQYDNK